MSERPSYPIIYVRGYAGTQGEVNEATEDPFYGFNLGSTHVRIGPKSDPQFFAFAGPLIRLVTERHYTRVYEGDIQQVVRGNVDQLSSAIWIYRYYDATANTFGAASQRLSIEDAAEGLRTLIAEVSKDSKKVILVAHSMGGLICRSLIQRTYPNHQQDPREYIDRFFTYGTPHGGIHFDLGGGLFEWVRDQIGWHNSDDFGYQRMWEYLTPDAERQGATYPAAFSTRANIIPNFPPERIFCVIGTNSADYEVLYGGSRKAVGPQSDGLVQIEHAYVKNAHRAYVHRSHSGRYGMVNSEEGYQSLQRFCFGDIMVKIAMANLNLPQDPTHYFQADARISIRGLPIYVNEQSVAHSCPILLNKDSDGTYPLFTAFLMPQLSHAPDGSCRYTVDLTIFSVTKKDGIFSMDQHVEGLPYWSDWLVVDVKEREEGALRYTGTFDWLSEMPRETNPRTPIENVASNIGEGLRLTIALPTPARNKLGQGACLYLDTFDWSGAYRETS